MVGVLLVAPACAFAALASPDVRRFRPAGLVLALAPPAAAFAGVYAVFLHAAEVASRTAWIPQATPTVAASVALQVLGLATDVHLDGLAPAASYACSQWVAFAAFAVVAVLACFGRWRAGLPFLAAALAYWLQTALYSLLVRPILLPRTALPGLIPFVGFLAVQLATVRPRRLRAAAVAAALVLSAAFAWQWVAAGAWQPHEDWKLAAATVASAWQPGDPVIVYPGYAADPIRYYAPGLPAAAFMEVAPGADPAGSARRLRARLSAAQPETAFLVLRADLAAGGNRDTCRQLLSLVRTELGPSGAPLRVALLAPDVDIAEELHHTRRDFLAELERAFGPPLSLQRFGSLTLGTYGGAADESVEKRAR